MKARRRERGGDGVKGDVVATLGLNHLHFAAASTTDESSSPERGIDCGASAVAYT